MAVPSPSGQPRKLPPRNDPPPRHIDATVPGTRLLNTDPAYDYVWAYRAGESTGLVKYLEEGWEVCYQQDPRKNPDTLKLASGMTTRPEDEISWRGNVLVRKLKTEVRRHRREGGDFADGMDRFEEIIGRVRKGVVPDDPMMATSRLVSFMPSHSQGADSKNNEDHETMVSTRT